MSSLAVIWRAGGLVFSTAVADVVEVLAPVQAEPCSAVPGWVRGLFVYRGTLIPLVDVAGLLGRNPQEDRMSNRVIVVRVGEHAALERAGLWVENVLELDRPAFEAPGSHPGFWVEQSRFLGKVAQTRYGAVQEVRPRELFTPEQAELLWSRVKAGAA
ncbi:MAG: chemotaxis protein CheW [Phycisphaeraceae bacterium]|nr:chemotaxis protein CheW [Phycisphaeraceae bacterium]